MKRFGFLLVLLTLLPSLAFAWWNADWGYKKKISLDVKKLQQDGVTVPGDAFALVRLHTGNFTYFLDLAEKGKDIRVLSGDEATPLPFYIEKLDTVNEMALIWVKLPKDIAATPEPSFWLYYGNAEAVDAQDASGAFDDSEVLAYQFDQNAVQDLTSNANHPTEATATNGESGLIGGAAVFDGHQIIRVPAKPSLLMSPATGWTAATWAKIDAPQADTVVFQRTGAAGAVTLAIKEQTPYLQVTDASGAKKDFVGTATLVPATWQHLSVVATASDVTLYVNGAAAGVFPVVLADLTGDMTIGADATNARGLVGALDELTIYKVARDANAIKFDVQMQGVGSTVLTYGDDATPDSEGGGESYFMATLDNVTIDGWVIIGILGVMFVISWMVMFSKAIVITRVHGANKKFEQAFAGLSVQELSVLNSAGSEDDDFDESPLLFSLTSASDDFMGSSIYRIYHVAVEEMNKRLAKNTNSLGVPQTLSGGAMAAVRASMDAVLVRELQKLNSQMVLLTIAISGGPFLGLLGTVVGVMITFSAIAMSGEVNVNSIAPGIAAALVATVAGLAVAIPALFGYNYLGGRIKEISADMHVFVDEFVAKLAEQHT
jgi:biopolymer transport protein ExbB